VVGGLVATLAATARIVGPFAAGILAATPIILSVVVPATHRGAGPLAAADLVRGTLVGLPGAVAFTTVVAYTVDSLGALPGSVTAVAVLLLVNLLPWRRVSTLRRSPIELGGGDPAPDQARSPRAAQEASVRVAQEPGPRGCPGAPGAPVVPPPGELVDVVPPVVVPVVPVVVPVVAPPVPVIGIPLGVTSHQRAPKLFRPWPLVSPGLRSPAK
jgi:hypothetical protein